nr:chemotaxis protein CheB [Umezawaea beigongshangensis]
MRAAADDDELAAGTVLVAPEAHHLIVAPSTRIGLPDSGALSPARPSADLLLATLAVTCGPRALAVVLTGRGTGAQAGTTCSVALGAHRRGCNRGANRR